MIQVNWFSVASFFTAGICLCFSLFFSFYGRNRLHRVWALFNLAIAGWSFFVGLAVLVQDAQKAYNLWIAAHFLGLYISVFFFHSVCAFLGKPHRKLILGAYIYGGFGGFGGLVHHGELIYNSTKYLFNSINYLQVDLVTFNLYLGPWYFLIVYSCVLLYRKARGNRNEEGNQARWMLIPSLVGFSGGCSTLFPMMGINFYPLSILLIPVYVVLTTYAVFKYQFMDLKVVLEKSIVYSILITVITISYLAVVILLEKFLRYYLGYQSALTSVWAAFFIGALLIPLRNKIQFLLDRSLFKGTQAEIVEQNELFREEIVRTEKYKTLAPLIAGITQEIRNPLTALKGYGHFLPQKLEDKEFLLKFSEILAKETDKIDKLFYQLDNYGKPAPLAVEKLNIHEYLNDVVTVLGKIFFDKNIELTKDFQGNPSCCLVFDPNQVRQVLLNIITNAVEAMPQGGHIWIRTEQKQKFFKISIKDSGSGLSAEDLAHVFDPFFSLKEKNTGLGLSIVQGIIEAHKGTVAVSSRAGEGTEVVIRLPLIF